MANLALLTWTFLWLSFLCVGGGLGVIPEMERQAVTVHHWLTAREFVDGYTLSQLTPGPNMLVAVFVAWRRTEGTLSVHSIQSPRREVLDRKSTRLNSSHVSLSRMPSSA